MGLHGASWGMMQLVQLRGERIYRGASMLGCREIDSLVTNAVSQGLDGNHKFVEICQTEWNSIVSRESFERSPKHRKSSKVLADALVPSSSFLGQQTLNMQVINLKRVHWKRYPFQSPN